jgi:hypothetical protein
VSLALLVGIPAGILFVLAARRMARAEESARTRRYLRLSLAFLGLAWLPMAALAMFLLALVDPWPFSLRQGPDTASARTVVDVG